MRSAEIAEALQASFPGADCEPIGGADVVVRLSASASLALHLPDDFPADPPIVIASWGDGVKSVVGMDWHSRGDPAGQIQHALRQIVSQEGPYRLAWGVDPSTPLSEDAASARSARWHRVLTSAPTQPLLAPAISERIEPETAELLAQSSVLIIGLGSVGSYLAEQLGRLGIGAIKGIDDDLVEIHNLTRTVYSTADVGLPKPVAMARRLAGLRPEIKADFISGDVMRLDGSELRRLFTDVDLIIAATDQPAAQSRINALAYWAQRPVVFPSLYKGAKGGEVVFTVPGITACYECATGGRRTLTQVQEIEASRDPQDYGRLAGELALVADIHHVTSAALRVCVSMLAASKSIDAAAAQFITEALGRGHGMVMLGMEAEYSVFPSLMGDAAGQYAFQSVWLNSRTQSECPVCAEDSEPVDPFALMTFEMSESERERLRLLMQDGN